MNFIRQAGAMGKTGLLIGAIAAGLLMGPVQSEAAPLNQDTMDYLHIKEWHAAGYTGKGVGIMVEDVGRLDLDAPLLKGHVTPISRDRGNLEGERTSHSYRTVMTVRQFAPDADIHLATFEMDPNPAAPFNYLRKHPEISIHTKSLSTENLHGRFGENGIPFRFYKQGMQEAYNRGVFLNAAAGNEGSANITDHVGEREWFITGAAYLRAGQPVRKDYSSTGEGLLAMGLTDIKYNDCMDTACGSYQNFGGTSAATPVVSSMAALYSQYFKEKVGRLPSPEEIKAFILDNTIDMEAPGYDTNTGHGLFVLPKNPKDTKLIVLEEAEDSDSDGEVADTPTPPKDPEPVKPEPPVVAPPKAFLDVDSTMWTEDIINSLAARGVITGYPDGTYKPYKTIDRGQVALMLTRSLDLKPVRPAKDFKDVPKNHMYYNEIQAVYRAGIFDGTNGNFRPGEPLSRAQMAKVVTNAFGLKATTDANFPDVKGSWVEPYVNAMYSNGITTGNNGKYYPNEKVTREHYAAFLYRSLELQSK